MKKIVATALVGALALGFAACNKAPEETTTEAAEVETEATEGTTEASEETSEETTEETAPAVPEGYSIVEVQSDYLGVKVSFAALDDGRFAGNTIEQSKGSAQYGRTEMVVNFFEDEEWKMQNDVKYTIRIWARSDSYVDDQIKRYTAVEGANYVGVWNSEIEDKTKCHYELYTESNTYLDGRIVVEVDMYAYSDWMPMEEYKALVDTMIKTMNIEILDTNNLNDAEGNFPSPSGVYTVPSKITLDGKEYATYWTVPFSAPHAQIDFTDADGKKVTIREDGQNVPKYVSARIELEDPERYREVTFGDYSGICEKTTNRGYIQYEYTMVYAVDGDKETNMTFVLAYGADKTITTDEIKAIYADEDKTAEINAKLDAWAEAYFTQLVYNK